MPSQVDIDGHPTWVDDRGCPGVPRLLLHGGLSNIDELLNSIRTGLGERFHVAAFDRRGHEYTADTDADFHYEDVATETVRVLAQVVGGPAHLVGWSDGGIVGLIVALKRPDRVHRLAVIGANYDYDGVMPVEMTLNLRFVQELSKAYIERSPDGDDVIEAAPSTLVIGISQNRHLNGEKTAILNQQSQTLRDPSTDALPLDWSRLI